MFSYIKGEYVAGGSNFAVVDTGGIGFKIMTSYNSLRRLPAIGECVKMHIYFSVREDAMELFGFFDENELECFKMLLSVSGVGTRVGLAILSELSPEQFALAVATKDTKSLTKAAGVGSKLASRIILELTDKISKEQLVFSTPNSGNAANALNFGGGNDEAVAALVVLGYNQSEALRAVRSIDTEGLQIEDIIKAALKALMK